MGAAAVHARYPEVVAGLPGGFGAIYHQREPDAAVCHNLAFNAEGAIVDATSPDRVADALQAGEMPEFCQSSRWLSMNVLSLSPETVVCKSSEHALHELLDSLGFEVLSVPFRRVYEFGGSLHCATWDVRRASLREDYFPKQSYSPLIGS